MTEIVFGPRQSVRPGDVGFVFGTTHPEAITLTVRGFRHGLFRHVIVTGGYKPTRHAHATWAHGDAPEADVIVRGLVRQGVPETAISFENRSTNSLENVLFGLAVHPLEDGRTVVAVCKTYAAGRQCRTLSKHLGPRTSVIPLTYSTQIRGVGPFVTRENWHHGPEVARVVWSNFVKIHYYGRKGHLLSPESSSASLLDKVAASAERVIGPQ